MRRDSAEIWQMSWLGLSQAFMHAGRESSHRYSKIAPSVPSVRLCDKGYWWINFSIDYYLSHILWYRSTTDFLIVFCGFCGIFLIILYKFFHWFFFFLEVLFFSPRGASMPTRVGDGQWWFFELLRLLLLSRFLILTCIFSTCSMQVSWTLVDRQSHGFWLSRVMGSLLNRLLENIR